MSVSAVSKGNCPCKNHAEHTSSYFEKRLKTLWHVTWQKVISAVSICPLAIRFAGEDFKDNLEIAQIATDTDALALHWFSDRIKTHPEISESAKRSLFERHTQSHHTHRFFYANTPTVPQLSFIDSIKEQIKTTPEFFRPESIANPFIRDSSVTLHGRSRLLPYPIKESQIKKLGRTQCDLFKANLVAMMPPTASPLVLPKTGKPDFSGLCGVGFQDENIEQAMILAYISDLSYIRGRTAIEGGNCFLFTSKGERKALVREISIYVSMLALEEQNAFDGLQPLEPSEESYRMARNLDLFEKIKKPAGTLKTPEEVSYRKQLLAPVTPEDKVKYHDEAAKIEAKLQATKAVIAQELGIDSKNVIFLP